MRKNCSVCGKQFEAIRNAKYCSEECRKKARYTSQRERYAGIHNPIVCIKCGQLFTPRTKYAKDRLFCYDCVPEYIDNNNEVKLRELPTKTRKKVLKHRANVRQYEKIKRLEASTKNDTNIRPRKSD